MNDNYLDDIKLPEEIREEKRAKKAARMEAEGIVDYGWKYELASWFRIVVITLAVALFFDNFIIINANVPTGSMKATIMEKDLMIGNRLAYVWSEPKRGDIIIFKAPDKPSDLFVKRVIGLPGETVTITDGKVYINGSNVPLEEPYIYDENGQEWKDTGMEYTVPEDSYFVMGDHRNHSNDSRFWKNTFVHKDVIKAQAMFVYWPISDWTVLGGHDYE